MLYRFMIDVYDCCSVMKVLCYSEWVDIIHDCCSIMKILIPHIGDQYL